jgi:hypothetical protein
MSLPSWFTSKEADDELRRFTARKSKGDVASGFAHVVEGLPVAAMMNKTLDVGQRTKGSDARMNHESGMFATILRSIPRSKTPSSMTEFIRLHEPSAAVGVVYGGGGSASASASASRRDEHLKHLRDFVTENDSRLGREGTTTVVMGDGRHHVQENKSEADYADVRHTLRTKAGDAYVQEQLSTMNQEVDGLYAECMSLVSDCRNEEKIMKTIDGILAVLRREVEVKSAHAFNSGAAEEFFSDHTAQMRLAAAIGARTVTPSHTRPGGRHLGGTAADGEVGKHDETADLARMALMMKDALLYQKLEGGYEKYRETGKAEVDLAELCAVLYNALRDETSSVEDSIRNRYGDDRSGDVLEIIASSGLSI